MIHKTSLEIRPKNGKGPGKSHTTKLGVWDKKWEGSGFKTSIYFLTCIDDSVAQWIRRWSTKPEILGSDPPQSRFSSWSSLESFMINNTSLESFMINNTSLESHTTKLGVWDEKMGRHNLYKTSIYFSTCIDDSTRESVLFMIHKTSLESHTKMGRVGF